MCRYALINWNQILFLSAHDHMESSRVQAMEKNSHFYLMFDELTMYIVLCVRAILLGTQLDLCQFTLSLCYLGPGITYPS